MNHHLCTCLYLHWDTQVVKLRKPPLQRSTSRCARSMSWRWNQTENRCRSMASQKHANTRSPLEDLRRRTTKQAAMYEQSGYGSNFERLREHFRNCCGRGPRPGMIFVVVLRGRNFLAKWLWWNNKHFFDVKHVFDIISLFCCIFWRQFCDVITFFDVKK